MCIHALRRNSNRKSHVLLIHKYMPFFLLQHLKGYATEETSYFTKVGTLFSIFGNNCFSIACSFRGIRTFEKYLFQTVTLHYKKFAKSLKYN